ncbi:glycine rich domain-containing protein [Flavobacterium sp.]|uniref:glycine rich domain-containing protein n=1 Tax=Flavobacterium sp. TaxID=239 RepID=UPI00286ED588|nr:glycine rich domain-containing protein [Flavobacterium sp.]
MNQNRLLSLLVVLFFNWSYGQLNSPFIQMKPKLVNYTHKDTLIFTGAAQSWIVPANVTKILVDAYGAQGGDKNTTAGGFGGRMQAIIKVTPGDTLRIMVGGKPSGISAVYGNGGNAGTNTTDTSNQSAGGGGMTALFRNSIDMANVLLVAGGGGGAATGRIGGHAGGLVGSVAAFDDTRGGKGGTQTAGGARGSELDGQFTPPAAGGLGFGGRGGSITLSSYNSGGGGGAGYYGGGGGAGGGTYYGAGGGGSSYVFPTNTTSIKFYTASNTGDGKMIISY